MTHPSEPVRENISLRDKNTYRVGGCARYFARCTDGIQVAALLDWARNMQCAVFVLGRGSNLLISEDGWPGLVIHFDDDAAQTTAVTWQENAATVSAALPLNDFVKDVTDRGCAGIEELAGIPGTVGGAVIMNAGAFSQCIADTLYSVTCCSRSNGAISTVAAADLDLRYRGSSLKDTGDIVLSARFSFLKNAQPEELNRRRLDILARRKEKQPLDLPNCGSVFKRPPGNYAGTLIEKCGLKGERVGGAEVSHKHANFIVNTGSATATDIRRLIILVQKRVYEQSGILLEPEVIFVGPFDDDLFRPVE